MTARQLALALVVFSLTSCYQVTDYPTPLVSKSTAVSTTFVIHWVKDVDEAKAHCTGTGETIVIGCTVASPGSGIYDVYAQEPNDFDDVPRLATLGHEVWHTLGAQHK